MVALVGVFVDDDTAVDLSASGRAEIPKHVALPVLLFLSA